MNKHLDDLLFGIAIRLPFSLRNEESSSRTLFFTKTLPISEHEGSNRGMTVFPTNLKMQEKYKEHLNQVLFFTPDLSSLFEGDINDIIDDFDWEYVKGNSDLYPELYPKLYQRSKEVDLSVFTELKKSDCNWIIIENLKEIELKDIQHYYVYGTNYSLADKMQEPAFPRIYYTDTVTTARYKDSKYSFCPYCGKRLGSDDFIYCPYCGSSMRI